MIRKGSAGAEQLLISIECDARYFINRLRDCRDALNSGRRCFGRTSTARKSRGISLVLHARLIFVQEHITVRWTNDDYASQRYSDRVTENSATQSSMPTFGKYCMIAKDERPPSARRVPRQTIYLIALYDQDQSASGSPHLSKSYLQLRPAKRPYQSCIGQIEMGHCRRLRHP